MAASPSGNWVHEMDPEDALRMSQGRPIKTYVPGPGIRFDTESGQATNMGRGQHGGHPGDAATWARTRSAGPWERRERSKKAYIKLLSHLDKTGRLLTPAFSREVTIQPGPGYQGTARPSIRYPLPDDTPQAVADRIAWATAHRYLSEYHDKFSETARLSATARSANSLSRSAENGVVATDFGAVPAAGKARPATAGATRPAFSPTGGQYGGGGGTGGTGGTSGGSSTLHLTRPRTAGTLRPTLPAARGTDALAEAQFPKDWPSLTHVDLAKTKPWGDKALGQHVVPGSVHAKLVGGRHRLVPRDVGVQDPAWTDYYGPVGGGADTHTYYGRKYNDRQGRGLAAAAEATQTY